MATLVTISLTIGSDFETATIRKSNSSTPIVADVLGVERDERGIPNKVYLRSKIHGVSDKSVKYDGWEPSGAISTILSRIDNIELVKPGCINA